MEKNSNGFFEEMAKILSDAGGAAQGLRKETESFLQLQCEKMIGRLNLIQREEFDALKEMVQKQYEKNEELSARLEKLEKGPSHKK